MPIKIKPHSKAIWLLSVSIILASCAGASNERTATNESVLDDPPVVDQAERTTMIPETESQSKANSEPALTYESITLSDGTSLEYALFLPAGYDPERDYPVLLALPPGAQTREMVDAGMSGYWGHGPVDRDWIVISPAAPDGRLFFQGSELLIPEFLEEIASEYPPEGGKFHLAGISNGGISAFRLVVNQPEKFRSILVVPGFPKGEDFQKLKNLAGIPVAMFVGEFDSSWREAMISTEQELSRLNIPATLEIVPGEGHVIQGLSGDRLFDLLESFR
jgi:predicted peptidase